MGTMRKKLEDCFFGAVTVGERGQIVIPAEARAELDLNPGDKVMVMRDPTKDGLMLFKVSAAREFLGELRNMLDRAVEESEKEEGKE